MTTPESLITANELAARQRQAAADGVPGPVVLDATALLPAPDAVMVADPESSIDVAQVNGRLRGSSVRKMAEVVNQHPDESVQIIRGWLNNI